MFEEQEHVLFKQYHLCIAVSNTVALTHLLRVPSTPASRRKYPCPTQLRVHYPLLLSVFCQSFRFNYMSYFQGVDLFKTVVQLGTLPLSSS